MTTKDQNSDNSEQNEHVMHDVQSDIELINLPPKVHLLFFNQNVKEKIVIQ